MPDLVKENKMPESSKVDSLIEPARKKVVKDSKTNWHLVECHHESRTGTEVGDRIIYALDSNRALRYLSDSDRKTLHRRAVSVDFNLPVSVTCSYTDESDGLIYHKEYTVIDSFDSEEEAESCKRSHHENLTTVKI